jgi:8-oxo-dGTP pyrophosphatase MutT (NUDIX family)
MTTLGMLLTGRANGKTAAQPLDINHLAATVGIAQRDHMIASGQPGVKPLGDLRTIVAALAAWINQDDDAHETCSLTACRTPLHPGPCKGWKHTLHSVSPHIWKQLEDERVKKANERRVKRIADLRSQNKPIPRRLLTEIKPKPAPTGQHPANNVKAVPLGQVNQKADLAGGQAHAAGQAVSNAAHVQVKTAPPLPLGPKQKKPTVAGRGPAFVITQPKVTDTYKLGKADQITPQQWAGLTDADKATIRNELTAIKARGFGPQQKKADELLLKLHSGNNPGTAPALTPGTPGTVTTPGGHTYQKVSLTPGKVSLGQAVKTPPSTAQAVTHARSLDQAHAALRITEAIFGKQNTDVTKLADAFSQMKASGTDITQDPKFRILVDRLANAALKLASADNMPGLGHGTNDVGITEFNHEIRDHLAGAKPGLPPLIKRMQDHHDNAVLGPAVPAAPSLPRGTPDLLDNVRKAQDPSAKLSLAARTYVYRKLSKAQFDSLDDGTKKKVLDDLDEQIAKGTGPGKLAQDLKDTFKPGASGTPAPSTPAAPASSPGTPSTPNVLSPDAQQARAVAGRAVPKAHMAKTQTDAYGKLSKADFDQLDSTTQRKIRDDLANAKAKFLDPKKQQAAQHLLDRFGSTHTTPAPNAPAAPAVGTGYNDPQTQAVKAASSGLIDNDEVIKTVARLSPGQVKSLSEEDRKKIIGRLAFVATHPKAAPEQKAKAAAYKRIIEDGSPAAGGKWDHAPSIGELHAEEKKTGATAAMDALKAAETKSGALGMSRDDRLKALGALSKAQFDALTPEQQRKITDALNELHTSNKNVNGSTVLDPAAGDALTKYTGLHPGVARMQQAEADFRAGKIDANKLWEEMLHARLQSPGAYGSQTSPAALLAKESQRIAEDNPKLPLWLRATMIDNPYGAPGGLYHSISEASNKYNWEDAPRLSSSDISDLFSANLDHLAGAHPIHAEAVKALREHVILTGLRGQPGVPSGSPWSSATRNHVVDNLLHISSTGDHDVPAERLREFHTLSPTAQSRVKAVLRERLANQTNSYAKTGTYITLRDIDGDPKLSDDAEAALRAAADSYANPNNLDIYRKLDPADYNRLPDYVRGSINTHLMQLQNRAEARPPVPWTPQDNPFKVMPLSLVAHLSGTRNAYHDRATRNAADIAQYGTKIIDPSSRTEAYRSLGSFQTFSTLTPFERSKVTDDLDKIENDSSLTLSQRYDAAFTKDFAIGEPKVTASKFDANQMMAIGSVSPSRTVADHVAASNLNNLPKSEYDSLPPAFRDAIDERIKSLPGTDQQVLNAKFHPNAPQTATPAGVTPTTVQTGVPPHVQAALDTIYGVHPKSHTMAHQLSTYGALRGGDFNNLNSQEQGHLLGDLSFIQTTAKGPSAAKAKLLIDRFTPPGTPSGHVPTGAIIPPANAVAGQVRYATPLKGLAKAKDSGKSGDGWMSLPGGGRVWGHHGAAGLLLQHTDSQTGEKRYLMVQRGPAISDPGKWTFPGGASDSKETPHEGATRETIEELGLKDDVFKDALVHGDHTFTVPNSSWKYTTVAASVPTMIKPNLTTAHARAETSDAKWMTLDEIRALDKAGSLHHPIAGGKLEQNVISLYPTGGTGVTLGQVARPGPVTKRLGRLNMPSGGRQAPANFNAWPHPHKQSKGKNLVSDKTAIDSMRQQVKQDRKLYDGKTADGRLAAIGAMQGFDDTPTVESKAEIDRLLATGDYIEAWRGVTGAGGGWSARSRGGSGGKTAADINEEMRTGPAYYGKGIFGNGYYLATSKRVAEQYSDHSKGSIVRVLIPKSAVMEKYDKVEREAQANSSRISKAKGSSYEVSTFWDPGRWGAARGLDGIEINPHHRAHGGGGAGHVASHGKPAFNWLNRSVLIVQKEPG